MLTCVYQGRDPLLADVRGKEGMWVMVSAESDDIQIQFSDLALDKKWTHAWTNVPIVDVAFIIFFQNHPMRLRVSNRKQAFTLKQIWMDWINEKKSDDDLIITLRDALLGRPV